MSDMAGLSDVREHLIKAEREAMEAQVEYELRNRITRNVLAMDPVLKAVYGSDRSGHDEK